MKILLTGARSMATLDLARHLHRAGHQILVADTDRAPICRFSNAVSKHIQIPSPRFDTDRFNDGLVEVVRKEGIEMLIPTWEEVVYISRILERFPTSCEVFCSPFEKVNRLHNKYLFNALLRDLGLKAPYTELIRDTKDLDNLAFAMPYALKACYCRGSDSLFKVQPWEEAPSVAISAENPWIAQEWIEGQRFCTYTVCKAGEVLAHSVYPVEFAPSGQFAVTFEAVNHPEILRWTKKLVAAEQFTGQIAFDFIEASDKGLYAIDCNPRITSGVHLFRPADNLPSAFTAKPNTPILAKAKTRQQIVPGMVMYGWRSIRSIEDVGLYLKRLLSVKDTVFRLDDPGPMLLAPFLFTWAWIKSQRAGLSMPVMFSHDVEWSAEAFPPGKEELA